MFSVQVFHTTRREPTLLISLGQLLHGYTRKLGLVRKIFHFGLAISFNHLLEIAAKMGNIVTESSERKFIVYPLSLQYGLFTTAATDIISQVINHHFTEL